MSLRPKLLFDSLRQGFPIGSFLFIRESAEIQLAPRAFHGAAKDAEAKSADVLVLDGQQRITAGLELFHGAADVQYFLDLDRIYHLFHDRGGNISDNSSIRKFLSELEVEDEYCVAKRNIVDPHSLLLKRHHLWTADLIDHIELKRSLKNYSKKYPDREEFVEFVIGSNFAPASGASVPITLIEGQVSAEAVTRIFSTLNSTGKMLTPFELVVAVLYPDVNLVDDVEVAREAYPYYKRIDPSGDILLQTIALFSGVETRKAFFPKTITVSRYKQHYQDAVKYLDFSARVLTEKVGIGLDFSSELLVYPVIFPPMAFVLKWLTDRNLSAQERAAAEHKLAKWFIGAVLSRRYQQSTHDKQAKDKDDIPRWIEDDSAVPQWLKDVWIPNLKSSVPSGATGKLLRALLNARGLKDPYSGKSVGIGSGKQTSDLHHIFPTKFVKNLAGWTKDDSPNRILNMMYTEESTNAAWLHIDPCQQILNSIAVDGNESRARSVYYVHGISDLAFDILKNPQKNRDDYIKFLEEREKFFVSLLGEWGFQQPQKPWDESDDEVDEDY